MKKLLIAKNLTKNEIFNLFLLLIFLVLIEICSFIIVIYKYHNAILDAKLYENIEHWFSLHSFSLIENNFEFRKPFISDDSKKFPIVILGCSFGYGTCLKNEETIAGQLSKIKNIK